MKVTRLIRKLSSSFANADKKHKPIIARNHGDILLKFENVRQKLDKKWSKLQNIVIKKSENGEINLYLMENSNYSYYEVYNLSNSFVEQYYDNSSKKCQILLVESSISLKFATISDKWRMVEFLRANIINDAISCQGILKHRPNIHAKTQQHVQIHVKSTSMYIINSKTSKIIAHVNLKIHIGFMGCVTDSLYFTKLNEPQIRLSGEKNNDYWSVFIGEKNIENLWKKMRKNHQSNNLDQYYSFVRIFRLFI